MNRYWFFLDRGKVYAVKTDNPLFGLEMSDKRAAELVELMQASTDRFMRHWNEMFPRKQRERRLP